MNHAGDYRLLSQTSVQDFGLVLLWPFTVPICVLATRQGKALLRWLGGLLLWMIVAGTLATILTPPPAFTLAS